MFVFTKISNRNSEVPVNIATVQDAREIARRLEHRERGRGASVKDARSTLARRIGVTPATWRNLALGRLKRLDAWMRDKLNGLLINELEAEIARLSHELEIARQCGSHPGSSQVGEIETHLAKAKALLGEMN